MPKRTIRPTPLSLEEDLRQQMYILLQQSGGNPAQLLELLSLVVENRVWDKLGISFSQFVALTFDKGGIGWSTENVRAILQMQHPHEGMDSMLAAKLDSLRHNVENLLTPTLAHRGGDRKSTRAKQNQKTNGQMIYTSTGNSRSATLSRLKRDRPDLARRVLEGEISANGAAIAAGFRQRSIQFYPDDLDRTAHVLRRHLKPGQIRGLIEKLKG